MKHNHPEKSKQDMGTGSVGKLLAQLAIPAVVAQVVNLLYNIVDRMTVRRKSWATVFPCC